MKQPRALSLLFFVQMWECFSFYGMRALLVLYMIEALSFSEHKSFGIYALYTGLVEMSVLLGGFLADKIWGLRKSIFLGGVLIACGHLSLAFADFFFGGLALIIVGSSLFKTNIKALLGLFYEQEDPRREAGFTYFYSGMNLGGLLATLLCGYVGHYYGWHAGFGLAALGMLAGLIFLFSKRHLLEDKGHAPISMARPLGVQITASIGVLASIPLCALLLQQSDLAILLFPLLGVGAAGYLFVQFKSLSAPEKKSVYSIFGMIAFLIIYFTFEELMGSMLMVFSNNYVSPTIFGFEVPPSVLLVMNPLTIILLGPLVARISSLQKLPAAFFCLAAAFALLYLGTLQALVSPFFLLGSFCAIALGELFLAPTLYAHCSRTAPLPLKGMMMSCVTMGFGIGSLLSGKLSQQIAPQTLQEYGRFFFQAAAIAAVIVFLLLLSKRFGLPKTLKRRETFFPET